MSTVLLLAKDVSASQEGLCSIHIYLLKEEGKCILWKGPNVHLTVVTFIDLSFTLKPRQLF